MRCYVGHLRILLCLVCLPSLILSFRIKSAYRSPHLSRSLSSSSSSSSSASMTQVLFVQSGFGCDQHGQNSTKACLRACRNAIEFNSIPCIQSIVPGGRENMKLRIQIAVPFASTVEKESIASVFPYGQIESISIKEGGMCASSGIVLEELGDKNDDMLIAVAVVTVGY